MKSSMKSSIKKLKDCRVRLTVEVEPTLVESRFQEVFRDIQKVARIPGFREGKAPQDLIEKKYSKEAHEEVLKSLIPEAYHRSVAEQKLSPVTLPSIQDVQMERGKPLKFAAEFDQEPDFNLKNYKNLKIKKALLDVTAEEIEKGLKSLIDSRAEMMPVEARPVQSGDFIVADVEMWQDEKYIPSRKNILLSVQPSEGDDFYQKILGASPEESREVTVQGKPMYKVWIRGIKEKKLPEVNDDFTKTFGKETVSDLKEAISKDLARQKQSESYNAMKAQAFNQLLNLVSFSLPDDLVLRQKERLIEQAKRQYIQMGMPQSKLEESLDKIRAEAENKAKEQVKLYFILRRIAEEEKIEVDEIELEQKLTAIVQESGRPIEEVRRVFEEDVRESMMEAKTVEFILANAKLEDVKEEVKK